MGIDNLRKYVSEANPKVNQLWMHLNIPLTHYLKKV